jgi:hypothetical protein
MQFGNLHLMWVTLSSRMQDENVTPKFLVWPEQSRPHAIPVNSEFGADLSKCGVQFLIQTTALHPEEPDASFEFGGEILGIETKTPPVGGV